MVLLFLLAPCQVLHAQEVGNCAASMGEGLLEVGNIRARIPNGGTLFYRGAPRVYDVAGFEGQSVFALASFLIGGVVDGEYRSAAAVYARDEFWACPLGPDGVAPDSLSCAAADRVWSISRDDVELYRRTGAISETMRTWPAALGAGVVDGDSNPSNYSLSGGDIPEILGDESVFWMMNDRGNTHLATGSPPLGVQVAGTAFGFNTTGTLANTTFYRYKISYLGRTPASLYLGVFSSAVSGDYRDDLAGTDTTRSMVYVYGGQDIDVISGSRPPAVGVALLKGPSDGENERGLGATMIPTDDGGGCGWPRNAVQYAAYAQGVFPSGISMTAMGSGCGEGGQRTTFARPGDPVAGEFWSMVNNGTGHYQSRYNTAFFMFTESFEMQPGETQEVVFAVIWARGDDRFDSILKLRESVDHIRQNREAILLPMPARQSAPREPELALLSNFPNPAAGTTSIRASIPQEAFVTLRVFDALGRTVATLQEGILDSGEHTFQFEAGDLPPGVYLYRMRMDHLTFSKTLLIVR